MKYFFKCFSCDNSEEIELPMSKVSSAIVNCPLCGGRMRQEYRNTNLVVPERMRAESITEMSYLNDIMKTKPTGRRKSVY